MVTRIPFQTEDVEKVPLISEGIKTMLRSNPKVFLEKEPPYCFLSRIERSFAELTLGCNLKQMVYFLSQVFLCYYSLLNADCHFIGIFCI